MGERKRRLITCHCYNVSQEFVEAANFIRWDYFSNEMCESLRKYADIGLSLNTIVRSLTTVWLTIANHISDEPLMTAI